METSDSQRDELNLIFKEENLGLDIEDIEDMVLHQEDLNNLGVKGEFEKSSEPSVGEPLSKKRKSNPSSTLIGEGVLQSLRLNSIEKEVILIKIKQNRLSNQLNKTQSLLEVLLKQVNKNQELLEIVISNQTTNQCSGSSGPIISSVEGQFENTGAAEDSGPISDDDDVIDSDVIGIDATDSDVIDIDVIIGATPEPDLPVSRPSSSLDTRVQTVLKDGSRSPRRTKPSKRSCTARGKIEYTSPLASKPASTSVTKDASSRVASGPASTSVMKDASSRVASGPASTTVKKDSSSALASKPASSSTVAKGNRFSIEPGISPLRDTRTYEDAEGLSKEALEENDEPVAHTSKDSFPAKVIDFMEKLDGKMSELYSKSFVDSAILMQLAKDMTSVNEEVKNLRHLITSLNSASHTDELYYTIKKFPVCNMEEFVQVEEDLQNDETKNNMVKILLGIGGETLEKSLRRSITMLMSPEFENGVNLTGRKSGNSVTAKSKFHGTTLYSCLNLTMKQLYDATDSQIDLGLQKVFKNSAQRLRNEIF